MWLKKRWLTSRGDYAVGGELATGTEVRISVDGRTTCRN